MKAAPVRLAFVPRLLSSADAARYLGGISQTTLRTLQIPRRVMGSRRLYDVHDLDAYASSLETDELEGGAWDKVFEGRSG